MKVIPECLPIYATMEVRPEQVIRDWLDMRGEEQRDAKKRLHDIQPKK